MTINREGVEQKGGGVLKKVLAASVLTAALAIPTLVVPASAADSVTRGRTIEAFIGTNLVNVQNYPAGKSVTVKVLRDGVLVGQATGKTGLRGATKGFLEINHAGGGQFPRGDCFAPPVTPDVIPGDVITAKVAGEVRTDRATVRDVFLDTEKTVVNDPTPGTEGGATITVQGHVRDLLETDALIDEEADVLELRLNANDFTWQSGERPGRKDLREQLPASEILADGTFTHVFEVSDADAANAANPARGIEQAFEWSRAVGEAAAPPAIFVSDAPEAEAIPGCPPVADNAVTDSNLSTLTRANIDRLRLSGISKDAATLSVTLDDRNAATDPVVFEGIVPTAVEAQSYSSFQTWKTAPLNADQLRLLRRLDDGPLTATTSAGGESLRIRKDTVA